MKRKRDVLQKKSNNLYLIFPLTMKRKMKKIFLKNKIRKQNNIFINTTPIISKKKFKVIFLHKIYLVF